MSRGYWGPCRVCDDQGLGLNLGSGFSQPRRDERLKVRLMWRFGGGVPVGSPFPRTWPKEPVLQVHLAWLTGTAPSLSLYFIF